MLSQRLHARTAVATITALASLALLPRPASAQTLPELFSIDFHGPTIGLPDSTYGFPITEADLLLAIPPGVGPLPPPGIVIGGGIPGPMPQALGLFLHPPAVGHPPGVPGFVEVDALSLGMDVQLTSDAHVNAGMVRFSVDEFAASSVATPLVPSVFTEGAVPVSEAAADVFRNVGTIILPNPVPPLAFGANQAVVDGDGLPSGTGFTYPGYGLIEPIPGGPPPNLGDNLDALTTNSDPNVVFFSLDSAFVDPHPLAAGTPNSGSAAAHGFVGGDIVASIALAGPPLLWCPATALGLDLVGGPDSDDLDALVLRENQNFVLELPLFPDDWVLGGKDMILFSVRRGSALITSGVTDSLRGLPFEEGDILIPPGVAGLRRPVPRTRASTSRPSPWAWPRSVPAPPRPRRPPWASPTISTRSTSPTSCRRR